MIACSLGVGLCTDLMLLWTTIECKEHMHTKSFVSLLRNDFIHRMTLKVFKKMEKRLTNECRKEISLYLTETHFGYVFVM